MNLAIVMLLSAMVPIIWGLKHQWEPRGYAEPILIWVIFAGPVIYFFGYFIVTFISGFVGMEVSGG